MTLATPNRRQLLVGIGAIIAAPAIVRASSLMKIKAIPESGGWAYFSEESAWFLLPFPEPPLQLLALMEKMRETKDIICANVFNPDSVRLRLGIPQDWSAYGSKAS